MNPIYSMLIGFLLFLSLFFFPTSLLADTHEFDRYEMSFKNFITCELTRPNATLHFNGKAFKITMIDLSALQRESGMVIVSGAIGCVVEGKYQLLYAAIGVEFILDKEQVRYYTIREKDFSILATELIRFPYKERCPWSRYWVDSD